MYLFKSKVVGKLIKDLSDFVNLEPEMSLVLHNFCLKLSRATSYNSSCILCKSSTQFAYVVVDESCA